MTDDDKALCKALRDGARFAESRDDRAACKQAATLIRELSAELDTVRKLARDMAEAVMCEIGWFAGYAGLHSALTAWQEHEGKQP